jgi:pimeloyl-[acyl-carrier protein] methyl ester esterase
MLFAANFDAPSGIKWNCLTSGEGEALLFIHGWGVDARVWRQQLKHFSKSYRVFAVDLPGHGKTAWKKMSLSEMSQDIKFILDQSAVKKMGVVGSSLGGLVALKLYALFPQVIQNIVFVGSMPKFSQSWDYPHGLDVARIRKLNGQVETAYPSIVNVFFRSLFTMDERQTRRFHWIQKFREQEQAPLQPALSEYLDILEKEDLRSVLKQVDRPLQFINGSDDPICDPVTVKYLKKVCPHSRFDDFNDCGHFPFLSKPYEFNQALESFLRSQFP